MTTRSNDWCEVLEIEVPDLSIVKDHREAIVYSKLIAALLERGEPMTLAEVAARFEELGIASSASALSSLKRCGPGRAPVYRDGEHYTLDPYDDELGLWVFRLGLRPPRPRDREAIEERLAALKHAVLVAYPPENARAVALLDVEARSIKTFVDDELDAFREALRPYDVIAAENVHATLRSLDVALGKKRFAELRPPQKTVTMGDGGQKMKLTTSLLVKGSCGIKRPFGDPKKLASYLAKDNIENLRLHLENDAKSYYSYYEYGLLHGFVRARKAKYYFEFPVRWPHSDTKWLRTIMKKAFETAAPIDVVMGEAPSWDEPQWARAQTAFAIEGNDPSPWQAQLVDERFRPIEEIDVQRARLAKRPPILRLV